MKNKTNNALLKIIAKAKELKKTNPNKKWKDLVSEASAWYRNNKK